MTMTNRTSCDGARLTQSARRRALAQRLIALLLILVGTAVSLWPVGETFYNNWVATTAVDDYSQSITASDADMLSAQRQTAAGYNGALMPAMLTDPWSDAQEATSVEHDDYLNELAGFGALGRIRIPSLAVDLPIYHDATGRSLALGAGHMYGTSLPVGGAGTHAVIAGHTGSTARTYFDRLNEAVIGTTFFIDSAGATLAYQVDKISVVSADDLSLIQRQDGQDLVTLVTCINGSAGERLLVRGTRIPLPERTTSEAPANSEPASTDLSIVDWMWPRLGVGGAGVLLVLLISSSWLRSHRRVVPALARETAQAPNHLEGPENDVQEDAIS